MKSSCCSSTTLTTSRPQKILVVWFSCLLSASLLINVVLLSHVVSCQAQQQQQQQQAEAVIDAAWFPGELRQQQGQESNDDFIKRITIQRNEQDKQNNNNDNNNKAVDTFDFFRLFDGKAQDPESDAFQRLTSFFQDVDPFGINNNNNSNNKDGTTGLPWWNKGVQQLSNHPERQQDEWWTQFQQGLSQREKFLTGLFLQSSDEVERTEGFMDTLRIFSDAFDEVKMHLGDTFGEINFLGQVDLIQFLFFMDNEEAVKNPVWKRRVHRHYRSLTTEGAQELYPGLYLSQLSYTSSCEQVHKYAQLMGEHEWALRNCTVESKPHEPAHFLAVRHIYDDGLDFLGPLEFLNAPIRAMGNFDALQVVLVVRGTKTVGDMLTDSVLKAAPYRGGLAHDGIQRAAVWLVETYKQDLKRLLKASGRKKIKLWIVGHSLGAGTAALTAIEFLECCGSWVDAEAVGFGTPAVLSPDLSDKYRNAITTVVTDADCVPRMSGPTLVNAWRRIVTHDHGDDVLLEFDHFMRVMQSKIPAVGQALAASVITDLRQWITESIETQLRPKIAAALQTNIPMRMPELVPPGECVHLYRDGTAWQGTYINCTFFDELDTVWHAVEDHLIPTGYYVGLLGFIRTKKQNVTWMFDYDLLDIPT